ncbi:MAG: hypothetical protein JSS10_09900 [Verrucomicrobia bacterium]|nr:hypothetical protein [Verrucomicrobiota bacterium]
MAITTSTETQPLLSHPLPPLTYTQKKALALTLGTFQLIGGIYGMYNAATDRERTSFNYNQFITSFVLTASGTLTNLLCLKGIFPFEFRHPEPVQHVAEVVSPAEPEPAAEELDLLPLLHKYRLPIADTPEEQRATLEEYIDRLLHTPESEREAAVSDVIQSLRALGQIRLSIGSVPSSRAGSRPTSAHTTPAPSPVKKGRDTTPTSRYATSVSVPGSPGDVEKGTLGSAKKQD